MLFDNHRDCSQGTDPSSRLPRQILKSGLEPPHGFRHRDEPNERPTDSHNATLDFHFLDDAHELNAYWSARASPSLPARFGSRTARRILMKFGMVTMLLKTAPKLHFCIPYNLKGTK
jgi:hypothetical protein